jgi:hypothetical protein
MLKLWIIRVMSHTLENRVKDIITHVTLNAINGVVLFGQSSLTPSRLRINNKDNETRQFFFTFATNLNHLT